MLRHRNWTTALIGAITVLLSVGSISSAAPALPSRALDVSNTTADTYFADAEECAFLGIINKHRKDNGLGALKISKTLGAAAEHHSIDMATKNYFSHTLAGGITWSQNIANHGYPTVSSRGENIAAGNATAAATFTQWKNSSGHNANMLSAKFNVIGIGRATTTTATYGAYWTTTFGSLTDAVYTGCGDGGVVTPPASVQYVIVGAGRRTGSNSSLYAFDNSLTTTWKTTQTTVPDYSYVYFDLGAVKSVKTIKWYFSAAGAADSYYVQTSTDKTTWTTVARLYNGPAKTWNSQSTTGSARYVRLYFKNPNGDKVLGNLAEVQVWS